MNALDQSLLYDRIEKLAPEHVEMIMCYLSYHVPDEHGFSLLASASDKLLQEIVSAAKVDLRLALKPPSHVISPPAISARRDSDTMQFQHKQAPDPYQQLYAEEKPEFGYLESKNQQQPQHQFFPFADRLEKFTLGGLDFPIDHFCKNDFDHSLNGRITSQRHYITDYSTKTCQYYIRGYCKHGNNCRYLHDRQASRDAFSPILRQSLNGVYDDQIFLPDSLEKLEIEIVEILKSRRGNPLSIASLPMVYYDRYRKVLQAEGYLTESQRQRKAGHSLTRLLLRLGSIKVIDRPHGQHAVVLAEDAIKYFESRNEGTLINSKSRQIYLTFPAESTFTEEDVAKYFSTYGAVEDVRIPCQHRRMFGFVTFGDPETVQTILAKGNPHYVCGARVLVKPYKDKSKLIDRKYQEGQLQHLHPYADADPELHSVPRGSEFSRFLQHQQLIMDEHVQAIELERRHLAQLQLMKEHYQQQQSHLINSMDALKISQDCSNVNLSTNHFNYMVDILNSSSAEEKEVNIRETVNPDQESDMLNLPESPFEWSIVNSLLKLD
ncbi:hypothetical protein SAY87_004089 [Trapa incisa]|uniref:Zinc finger CCCH domain-containing protein 18-like n=1 Tax=Trapa incisa TaxID=236973 RepID=A0AAN7JP06_9MYRT|nr:hypothetical protein SAY87_004089 [Trapa incisa]